MESTELSVQELSRAMGMNRVNLYRKLRVITGRSPSEFIRSIRMQQAARLLSCKQLNVSEVAYQVGFNNPKYSVNVSKKSLVFYLQFIKAALFLYKQQPDRFVSS